MVSGKASIDPWVRVIGDSATCFFFGGTNNIWPRFLKEPHESMDHKMSSTTKNWHAEHLERRPSDDNDSFNDLDAPRCKNARSSGSSGVTKESKNALQKFEHRKLVGF